MQGSHDLESFHPTCVSSLESDVNEDVDVQFKGAHPQVGIITQQSTHRLNGSWACRLLAMYY
jgi:hypothetical protein